MNILFVCNNVYAPGNGISVSVSTTVRNLRLHGIDARLMAVRNPDPEGDQPDFPLEHFVFPIFEPIIRASGFTYAKIDRKRIREAVRWADVVHLEEPMPLEKAVMKEANLQGKPCTATYHMYPYNITASLGLGRNNPFNRLFQAVWRLWMYDRCTDIQCPTPVVADYLRRTGFRSRLHVISNGIHVPSEPVCPQIIMPEGVIDVVAIGRYSREKSPEVLLEAMRYSRYADRIRLTFAGKGPKEALYRRHAERLVREGVISQPPVFGFYDREGLRSLAAHAYLYVHCATVEVEGLSCLEATREGAVPIIGQGEMVGTTRFALYPESLYPIRDSRALADRIDWWIEHPAERNEAARRYADAARSYGIDDSIVALEKMFRLAIGETCAD